MALLNERMIESNVHARKWLTAGGKMYPTSFDLFCAPFCDHQLYQEISAKGNFWRDKEFYGVDLSALEDLARDQAFSEPIVEAFGANHLCGPPTSIQFDLLTITEESLQEVNLPILVEATYRTTVHGFGIWFDAIFDGSTQRVCLSTSPMAPCTHWYQTRLLLKRPITLESGEILTGTVRMVTNRRQSYDLTVRVQVKGKDEIHEGTMNLKDPYFRSSQIFTTNNGATTSQQFEMHEANMIQ